MSIPFFEKKLLTLDEVELENRSVFCRLDLNTPLHNGAVSDDARIQGALPTIQHLLEKGSRITLASHLGRPKGGFTPEFSLLPVAERLAKLVQADVVLADDCVGDGLRKVFMEQEPGTIVLLENLRFHDEEKANDETFARKLKANHDVYVSDAFGAVHRAHASVEALPKLFQNRVCGRLIEKELKYLLPLLERPEKPYAVLLGGAKVSDKLKVIEMLIRKVDHLLIGGAMAFTFLRAMGRKTGASLVEEDRIKYVERILKDASSRKVQIHLPLDFQIARRMEEPFEASETEGIDIEEGWIGLDIGPKTVRRYVEVLSDCKTIFWNGPMGLFEKKPFDRGTHALAHALSLMQSNRIVGGGDSAAAVRQMGFETKMSHISTGGGATLELLEGQVLPGLKALSV